MAKPLRIIILASGRGSNFQAIIDGINNREVNAEIAALITDNPNAQAIERAKNAGIPYEIIDRKKFANSSDFDNSIFEAVDKYKPELIVLAGYMRLLKGREIFQKYKNRIINIHPSLLPKYPGLHAQRQAFEAGEKTGGLTIHFVDEQLDHGPMIYQEEIDISDCKSADEVSARILLREHEAYKKIVQSFSEGKYIIRENRARFVPKKKT